MQYTIGNPSQTIKVNCYNPFLDLSKVGSHVMDGEDLDIPPAKSRSSFPCSVICYVAESGRFSYVSKSERF